MSFPRGVTLGRYYGPRNIESELQELGACLFNEPVPLDSDGQPSARWWDLLKARFESLGLRARDRYADRGLLLLGASLGDWPHVVECDMRTYAMTLRPARRAVYLANEEKAVEARRLGMYEIVIDPQRAAGMDDWRVVVLDEDG